VGDVCNLCCQRGAGGSELLGLLGCGLLGGDGLGCHSVRHCFRSSGLSSVLGDGGGLLRGSSLGGGGLLRGG
jgi:hypothetical protein